MKKPNILCVICARGNSKGIRDKNLLKLNSKTLINITLNQAKKSNLFNKIVLSTDSNKIINNHKNLKFNYIINRPKYLATDNVGKIQVIKHALKKTEKFFNSKFDYIFDLDVSSPLRKLSDIKNSFIKFKKKNASNLITICRAKKNPYFNMVEIKGKNIKLAINKKKFTSRQSAPKVFDMNASIYIWKRKSLLSELLFNKNITYYKMPIKRSIDIDSYLDYKLVKFLYEKKLY